MKTWRDLVSNTHISQLLQQLGNKEQRSGLGDSAIHEEEQVCERSAPLGLGVWGKDLEKTLLADFDLKWFSLADWREPICMEQKADHHPLCEGDCWLRIILIW